MAYEIPGAERRDVTVGDITLSVYESGPATGQAVVLCHGFPELAYSWRAQLAALGDAGYHVIAPDQRGYGGSDRPGQVKAYDMFHLTDDLAGLVGELGHERAVYVGHDWGGLVAWQMPFMHPERVDGIVGVNTPFFPRFPQPPIELFRQLAGDDHYIVRFQEAGVADRALAADVPAVFTGLVRSGVAPEELAAAGRITDFVDGITGGDQPGEALLSGADLDVYVGEFTRTGFTGGLNWYRNMDRNWAETPEQSGDTSVDVPALMVTAEWDPVLTPAMAAGMGEYVPDLETHLIEHCGHWTQQEQPDRLNEIMLDWLGRRFPA